MRKRLSRGKLGLAYLSTGGRWPRGREMARWAGHASGKQATEYSRLAHLGLLRHHSFIPRTRHTGTLPALGLTASVILLCLTDHAHSPQHSQQSTGRGDEGCSHPDGFMLLLRKRSVVLPRFAFARLTSDQSKATFFLSFGPSSQT
jgi:hypothetical protein